jgi:predicted secreted protein
VKRKVVLLLIASLVAANAGLPRYALAQERVVTVSESENAGKITIGADQQLEIRLPVQGGTGYSWELDAASNAPVRLLESHLQAAEPGRPGGPQMQVLRFTRTGAGSGDLRLGYRRPWEKDRPSARTFTIQLTVL